MRHIKRKPKQFVLIVILTLVYSSIHLYGNDHILWSIVYCLLIFIMWMTFFITTSDEDVLLIESESIQLEREYIAINSIINDVLLLYFREIEHKDLDIQITETTHEIYIDKQATLRIINNVIVNALRFAERYIHIYYEHSGDKLTVTIENDTKETVTNPATLFERSVMGDSSRQGTHNGLGLYIVKKLMELQDGTAHIEVDEQVFKMQLMFEN